MPPSQVSCSATHPLTSTCEPVMVKTYGVMPVAVPSAAKVAVPLCPLATESERIQFHVAVPARVEYATPLKVKLSDTHWTMCESVSDAFEVAEKVGAVVVVVA